MKFSTFIIIALLALIAYGLLRPNPASSPSALRDILRVAQQLIPPPGPGGQDSRPASNQPILTPGLDGSANGKPSFGQPRMTWDPFTKGDDAMEQKQYTGRVRQHLDGECLLIRSGTRSDSGSMDEYVLAGFPGAADLALDSQIQFYAYSGGVVTVENDHETKTMPVLVHSSSAEARSQQRAQSPQSALPRQPAQDSQPPPPGSWMWQHNGSLDRGPYNHTNGL